jgi:hypothetical protein
MSSAHPARWPRTSLRCSRKRYSRSQSSTRKCPPSRLLTEQGLAAQAQHASLAKAVERRWRKRLGGDFDRLAKALITGPQLALGLHPYPDGWRAARNPYRTRTQAVLADPTSALPRYPMVLHRGGYPDGS